MELQVGETDAPQQAAVAKSTAISFELRRAARRARTPKPNVSGGGGFRARRSDRVFRWFVVVSFVIVFVMPGIASAVYFGVIASDRFVSEAKLVVRSSGDNSADMLGGLSSLLSGGPSNDSSVVAEYVRSGAILDEISRTIDVRKLYSPGTIDVFSELGLHASREDLIKFWRKQVDVTVERNTGLITLRLQSFSAESSLDLLNSVLQISERTVNDLTRRSEKTRLSEARSELNLAKHALEKAVATLRDIRNEMGILDVNLAAKSYSAIVTSLKLELAKVETELGSLRDNNASNAPQTPALEGRASALKEQISNYETQMAGVTATSRMGEKNLADRATQLAQREFEVEIARNEYEAAITAFESARLVMEKQRAYLLTYVKPKLAEDPLYPKRGLWILVSLAVSGLAWGGVVGAASLVRDHTA
ncbi:hypothetical protein IB267_32045 [Ensifer sp. ENS09]|uniref:hypothetical protein n=1 Tax=Ensifer sp. ENS09 TaxID=2769263 RepID=UPI0017807A2E|nr:hypothetical protein [Ensifer sp. ENS09]MBD9653000.1 hypothetical protein [Ensifer sp. ENS09]